MQFYKTVGKTRINPDFSIRSFITRRSFLQNSWQSTTQSMAFSHSSQSEVITQLSMFVSINQSAITFLHGIKLRQSFGSYWKARGDGQCLTAGTEESVASAVSNKVKLLSCIFMHQAFYLHLPKTDHSIPAGCCRVGRSIAMTH